MPTDRLVLTGVRQDLSPDKVRFEWVFKSGRYRGGEETRITGDSYTIVLVPQPKEAHSGPVEHTLALTLERKPNPQGSGLVTRTVELRTATLPQPGKPDKMSSASDTKALQEGLPPGPLSELVQVAWPSGDLRLPVDKVVCRVRRKVKVGGSNWTLRLVVRR